MDITDNISLIPLDGLALLIDLRARVDRTMV
jgi:hypothetical protein